MTSAHPETSPFLGILGANLNPSLIELLDFNSRFSATHPDIHARLVPVTITIISEFTLQGLIEPIRYFCRLLGVEPEIVIAPPYQIEAQLFSTQSTPATNRAQLYLVMFDLEKMCSHHNVAPKAEQRREFDAAVERRLNLCRDFSQRTQIKLIVSAFFSIYPGISKGFTASEELGRNSFVEEANRSLLTSCAELGLECLPLHHTLSSFGTQRCLSLKDYLASDSPFSPEGANRVGEMIARYTASFYTRRKKLLVLDLDNTLWRGVLGEDGPTGIQFRPDNFEGRIFWHALNHIRALADAGTVLAINSKNNEDEVLNLLDSQEFPLNRQDFAAIKAHWNDKHENLQTISEELGLGLDSMVMLDDSDVECLRLRQLCPEVTVVQVPKSLSEYPALLAALPYFEKPRVTEADVLRKLDYQNMHKRKQLASAHADFESFLKALNIELTLFRADTQSFDRVEQLFERTNQFNMSGKRFTRTELEAIATSGGLVVGVSYQDSFGSAGVIAALVGHRRGETVIIDNYVVSCRVLGRGVEKQILAALNQCLFEGKVSALSIVFQETGRNAPARSLIGELAVDSTGVVDTAKLLPSPHIAVVVRR
jgi:FkbH-like protein